MTLVFGMSTFCSTDSMHSAWHHPHKFVQNLPTNVISAWSDFVFHKASRHYTEHRLIGLFWSSSSCCRAWRSVSGSLSCSSMATSQMMAKLKGFLWGSAWKSQTLFRIWISWNARISQWKNSPDEFTDESKFMMYGSDRSVNVWRWTGYKNVPRHFKPTIR